MLLLLLPLCFLLAWAVPAAAISLAAGREAFMLPAVTQVEAEPLPHAVGGDGKQRPIMALEIMYEASLSGLNHSLYDATEVRQRIAQWLREQANLAGRTAGMARVETGRMPNKAIQAAARCLPP